MAYGYPQYYPQMPYYNAQQTAMPDQLAASQAAQNQYLVNTIRPCPVPAYTVANPFCCNQAQYCAG